MKLKLIPALLTLGLATFLGACETVSENAPTQPGSEADVPQGGAELEDSESPKYPPAQMPFLMIALLRHLRFLLLPMPKFLQFQIHQRQLTLLNPKPLNFRN